MDETELIIHVGGLMYENKILTDVGLRFLHNDFLADIAEPIQANELKKATRVCIFMTIVYNMTLLYGGYCTEHNLPVDHFERLKPIAVHFETTLPLLLKTLSNKYLEVFHGAKIAAFVKGRLFDDYLPNHPADEETLKTIDYKQDTEPIVLNV